VAGVGAPWPVMGELAREGREEEREEGRGARASWGGAAMEELGECSSVCAARVFCT
jgi:hypothetical protein